MSQDEKVDIIDENGNFIEAVYKKEAHEKGLLHKCVIANVIDSQGRWLLVKPVKGRQDAGQYQEPSTLRINHIRNYALMQKAFCISA